MHKNIFIYWHQGFDSAPNLVKRCVDRWTALNPAWNVVKIDKGNLKKFANLESYIPEIDDKKIALAHSSDIVRMILISTIGGLWVDSTTYCNRPLDEWLPGHTRERFFAFADPKFLKNPRKGIRPVSTWFLYSEPGHPIAERWLADICDYWSVRKKIHTYFAHHHLFARAYMDDAEFRTAWNAVPKVSNSPPHAFVPYGKRLPARLTPEIKAFIDSQSVSVFKLTRHGMNRFKKCFSDRETVIGYLLSKDPTSLSKNKGQIKGDIGQIKGGK